MTWIIIRTDRAKESYVARRLRDELGFETWLPVQIIPCRPQIARRVSAKAHVLKLKELPILPRRVFVQMPPQANTDALQAVFGKIRHLVAIERDGDQRPVRIASGAIEAFRAEIDRENEASLALATRPNRKQKAKWKSLREGLQEAIASARELVEMAA